nr:hypothetical protein CPGR_00216 [Mycolicibacter nonchromogenicus]
MYSVSSISPAASAARALRIWTVCGNEPMVVVGSGGRCNRSSWATRRASAELRWLPAARISAICARNAALFSRGSDLREATAALEASISAATASRPSRRARARATTSVTFSAPNASQLRKASSRPVSGSSE